MWLAWRLGYVWLTHKWMYPLDACLKTTAAVSMITECKLHKGKETMSCLSFQSYPPQIPGTHSINFFQHFIVATLKEFYSENPYTHHLYSITKMLLYLFYHISFHLLIILFSEACQSKLQHQHVSSWVHQHAYIRLNSISVEVFLLMKIYTS